MDQTNGEIIFASKFIDMIDDGVKTTTVRSGARNYVPGVYDLFNPAKSVHGLLKINGQKVVKFSELTEDVAQTDGFSSLTELKDELRCFYPTLTDESLVTIVYIEKF